MLSSSLIEILKTFTKDDLKLFEEFILSPYFNKKSPSVKLFRIIKKYAPEYKDERLKREEIWKVIFPGKSFNYGVMKNLIFHLQKLANDYLIHQKLMQKDFMSRLCFLEILSEKNLDQHFEKNVKFYRESLKNKKVDDNFFYEYTKLEGLIYNHNIINRSENKTENLNLNNFQKYLLMDFLRNYYILKTNVAMFKNDFSKNPDILHSLEVYIESLLQKFIKEQDEADYLYRNIILMYYNGYKLISTGDNKYFFELKNLMKQHSLSLDLSEQYNMYNLLTAFCVNKSLKGDNGFFNEEFDLYKTILEKEAYTIHRGGVMHRLTYFNMARTGIQLKEFEWTLEFLVKYKSRLAEDLREQTFMFTSAFLEFGRKNFLKSLEILSKLKHHEVRDKPREKMLYIMLYFELGYVEQLLSAIDSAKHFAKNDKQLSEEYKKKFSGFLNCVFNIAKIKFKLAETNVNLTLQSVNNEIKKNNVSHKNWLEGKLKEIITSS